MDIFGLLEQDTPYDNHDHMIKYFPVLLMIKYTSPNHIFCLIWADEMNSKPSEEPFDSVPNESSRVEFELILKYYLYSGLYPINCLNYIIYIMQVYASLMRVKIGTL